MYPLSDKIIKHNNSPIVVYWNHENAFEKNVNTRRQKSKLK